MRVIAGTARGIPLVAPPGNLVTRPTTDKVKEAVFGSIQFALAEAVVLDLFAGSGAWGIEALSRGAKAAYFVDKDAKAIQAVKTNLRATHLEKGAQVLKMPYLQALSTLEVRFDFVFLDPPYGSGYYQSAVDALLEGALLAPQGKVIAEHDGSLGLVGLREEKQKRYGKIYVSYYVKE